MLFKFSTSDMLNTDLINAHTGKVDYTVASRTNFIRGRSNEIIGLSSRTTRITNSKGVVVADIEWDGKEKRQPGDIKIMNEKPVHVSGLFNGCDKITVLPDLLSIPSRLGFIWIATQHSITVVDAESGESEGRCHEHSIHVGDRIIRSRLPRVGSTYLEFTEQSELVIAELLVGYILVDIMRRASFNLPKYDFSQAGKLERSKSLILGALDTLVSQKEHIADALDSLSSRKKSIIR